VELDIQIAGRAERLMAFGLDFLFMSVAIICLYALAILLFFSRANLAVGMTLILFLAFIVRNLYFIHFELAWQGRTPGKKICGLRVISRDGGELTPAAVIARNLTREVEVFLPLSLCLNFGFAAGFWAQLSLLGWVLGISLLPLFNRDHLRAGDLLGGTRVIAMPGRVLLDDLAAALPEKAETNPAYPAYRKTGGEPAATEPENTEPGAAGAEDRACFFTHEQLSIYGAFELQVLEELLRRPDTGDSLRLLVTVCEKIRRKIGWEGEVEEKETRRFLTEFYAAERAALEREQLFGRGRADKTGAEKTPQE
jgi:uncharacterized RDD family membrane protein YckC